MICSLLLSNFVVVLAEGESYSTDSVNIVLRPDNFVLTNIDNTAFKDVSTAKKPGILPEGKYFYFNSSTKKPDGNTSRAFTTVFIPCAGNYNIWAMTKDYTSAQGSRWAQLAVDGVTYDYKFNSNGTGKAENGGEDGWCWERGFSVALTPGLHSIEIAGIGTSLRLCAVMVTNNVDFDPNGKDYATVIKPMEDIDTLVSFNEDAALTLSLYDSSSIIAEWPQATDEGGISGYGIYINDAEAPVILEPDVQSYIISDLSQLEPVSVKIAAFDMHGHTATLESSTIFNDLDFKGVTFSDENGNNISEMNSLEDMNEMTAVFNLENKTAAVKSVLLGIAIYDKTTGAMIVNSRKAITLDENEVKTADVTVEIPDVVLNSPNNYKIYAALWDTVDNIAPQAAGILIE